MYFVRPRPTKSRDCGLGGNASHLPEPDVDERAYEDDVASAVSPAPVGWCGVLFGCTAEARGVQEWTFGAGRFHVRA